MLYFWQMLLLYDQASSNRLCSCSFSESWKFNLVSSSLMDSFWPFNWRRAEITLTFSVQRSIVYLVFSYMVFFTSPTLCAASISISYSFRCQKISFVWFRRHFHLWNMHALLHIFWLLGIVVFSSSCARPVLYRV